MPTIHVPVTFFNRLMGKTFTNEKLDEVCFNFGIEFEFEPKTDEAEVLILIFFLILRLLILLRLHQIDMICFQLKELLEIFRFIWVLIKISLGLSELVDFKIKNSSE